MPPRRDIPIESLARSHCPKAIATLARIVNSNKAPHAARVSAAIALLDRGYGRPKQETHSDITHRYVLEVPNLLSDAEWEKQAQGLQLPIDLPALPQKPENGGTLQ